MLFLPFSRFRGLFEPLARFAFAPLGSAKSF
jgi:hypothetical protein